MENGREDGRGRVERGEDSREEWREGIGLESGEREGGWKGKSEGRILGRKGKWGFVWKS